MKNHVSRALLLCLMLSVLASCGEEASSGTDETKPEQGSETEAVTEEPENTFVADDLPADLDFGGKEVKVFIGDYNNAYIDDMYAEETTGNRLTDAIYNQIQSVENRLNVDLVYNSESYTWDGLTKFQTSVVSGIMAGDNAFDILFDAGNFTAQMLEGEYFIDLSDTKYINIEKPWYNQTITANLANDYLHFLSGRFAIANIKNTFAMYFNSDLYHALDMEEDLYALVDAGKWTLDKFEEIIKDTYQDLDGDNVPSAADRFGLTFGDENKYLGFIKPLGVSVFEKTKDGYDFTFGNERAVSVIERLCSLMHENPSVMPAKGGDALQVSSGGGNYTSRPFLEDRSLFTLGLVADAAAIIPSIEFNYGLLPVPKWDEAEEKYHNMLQRSCYVLIPTTVEDADLASAALEAISSESYRSTIPEYFEVTLKVRYSQNNDIARMFDVICSAIDYDPGEIYNSSIGSPTIEFKSAITQNAPQWASRMESKQEKWITAINNIMGK